MYYVRCKDGSRYRVEAISLKAALSEIAMARVTGSIGSSSDSVDHIPGVPFDQLPRTIIAKVHRVNSDNTLQQPYTKVY